MLHKALSYTRVKHLATRAERLKNNGKHIETTDVQCYKDVTYAKEKNLITNAGYRDRIVLALENAGYKVACKDTRPAKNLKKFVPHWAGVDEFDFKYKQREALEAVAANQMGRLWWPTGSGKSFLVPLMCKLFPKCRIVVTTRFSAPLEDLFHNLSRYLPSVGIYYSRKKKQGERVMCYSAGCLHHVDPKKTDILIADEVHELATDNMFSKFSLFRTSRMYGLSANFDDRFDNADFELEGIFGPLIAQLTYEEGVANDMIVPINVYWRNMKMDRNPCGDMKDIAKMRHGIWRNEWRNAQIAEDARTFPDDQVLITVKTFEHACHLKKLLPEFTLCYAPNDDKEGDIDKYVKWGLLDKDEPRMTYDRLQMLKKRFEKGDLKKVIATTVWNRGVNFKKLQVLIRGDAGSSAIDDTQIPGRLSRTVEDMDKECGFLIDYLDQFDLSFSRRSSKRKQDYLGKSWAQIMPEDSNDLAKQMKV